ncbi:MAG: phytanoyl-CoA dioxygenase family protein [Firmicutes bacterium]|jgi:ectoine hydroxylase-related dioxygenase (phytanoyl-CoA dioxygenase family)|nr:phytanoyl-CoA dioxygenase family protein [Bacillota bacterium]MCL5064535.1 phytanoyl-CoA dioxygenase family protein [Bacillota bacterium]
MMRAQLTQAQIDFYQTNGFLAIDNLLTADEVARLAQSMEESMDAEGISQRSVHSATQGPYYRVLNQKVNAWRDHGGIAQFTCSSDLAEMARKLAGVNGIRLFHDHILWKMPGDSKPTPWHQDLPFWPMEEPQALSFWITVDDVDETNGCMMFVPKSQRAGKLKAISLVEPEDLFSYANRAGVTPEKPLIARLRAGSCTVHSGLTFHYAHANQTARARRVLAIIYIPEGARYTGRPHVVSDGAGLQSGDTFHGGLFPRLA